MNAYIWYGETDVSGYEQVTMTTTQAEICLRGHPWIDYNCACLIPYEWYCFDPEPAEIECNVPFTRYDQGFIDYRGEGEVWFNELICR